MYCILAFAVHTIFSNTLFAETVKDHFNSTSLGEEVTEVPIEIVRQRRECQYAHTLIRQLHGLYMMHWNEELAYEAEQWAIHLASDVGSLEHSTFKFANGTRYGENLYELSGGNDPARCYMAVYQWYSEIHKYNFDNPNPSGSTGHFTQLIWSVTNHFGVGVAYSKDNKRTFIVARYTPPGDTDYDPKTISKYVKRLLPGSVLPNRAELLPKWARKPLFAEVDVEKEQNGKNGKDCLDTAEDCKYFFDQGNCDSSLYKAWMQINCYETCSKCTPGAPVNGGWSRWHKVSSCSVSCGGGRLISYRFCTDPVLENNGNYCKGSDVQSEFCNAKDCPNNVDINDVDRNKDCYKYTDMGYCFCGPYVRWMHENCKKSCELYFKDYWVEGTPSSLHESTLSIIHQHAMHSNSNRK